MSSELLESIDAELEQATLRLAAIEAELSRRHFKSFVHQAWHLVEPDQELRWNWHLDVLCEDLEAIERGDVQREIFNVPPGTMKSLLVNVFFPAWVWARNSAKRILSASYSSSLSIRDNLRLRTIITSEWYQSNYGVGAISIQEYDGGGWVELQGDQNAKQRFNTTNGGWRIATSVGGIGTGEHPDIIVIDDPTSADQARSDLERQAANDWFDRTVSTRGVSRNVAVIVVMQRLHMEDLTGHLLAKDRAGWKLTCFPMRYEKYDPETPDRVPDWRDPRTVPGELLWPELFTEAKVKQLELDLGPYGAAGQLQQRPAPEGGGLFKREWFKFVDVAPIVARRIRCWDTAATEEGERRGGDYTVGAKIAEDKGSFYVEDVRRERLGPAGVDSLIRGTAEADGKGCGVRELREPGASGKAIITARLKLLAGFDYGEVLVSGDKITMAKVFRAQCEGGNVYLVRGAWNELFIQELTVFPTGNHDDQVDAASNGLNAVLLEPVPVKRATWGS